MRVLVLALLLSQSVWALDLKVVGRLANYNLKFQDKEVSIKGAQIDLTIKKEKCNSNVLKEFMFSLEKLMQSIPRHVSTTARSLKVTYNKDSFFIPEHLKQASILQDMRKTFIYNKKLSEIMCKK